MSYGYSQQSLAYQQQAQRYAAQQAAQQRGAPQSGTTPQQPQQTTTATSALPPSKPLSAIGGSGYLSAQSKQTNPMSQQPNTMTQSSNPSTSTNPMTRGYPPTMSYNPAMRMPATTTTTPYGMNPLMAQQMMAARGGMMAGMNPMAMNTMSQMGLSSYPTSTMNRGGYNNRGGRGRGYNNRGRGGAYGGGGRGRGNTPRGRGRGRGRGGGRGRGNYRGGYTGNNNNNNNNSTMEPSQVACKYYGSELGCRFGDLCHYSHAQPNSVPMCKNFSNGGNCYYGDKCHYRHKELAAGDKVPTNTGGIPFGGVKRFGSTGGGANLGNIDGDESVPICKFFGEGACTRGIQCRFRHINITEEKKQDVGVNKDIVKEETKVDDPSKVNVYNNNNGNVDDITKGINNLNVESTKIDDGTGN